MTDRPMDRWVKRARALLEPTAALEVLSDDHGERPWSVEDGRRLSDEGILHVKRLCEATTVAGREEPRDFDYQAWSEEQRAFGYQRGLEFLQRPGVKEAFRLGREIDRLVPPGRWGIQELL